MSVIACVKVYDGMVLGCESMTQLWGPGQPASPTGQPQFIKAFSNARKLFRIADLPFGVLAYGAGNLRNRSIESYLFEFSDTLKGQASRTELSAQQIGQQLFDFIRQPYEESFSALPQPQRPNLGFYVAGYSPGQHLGSEWEFVLPQNDRPVQARPDDQVGASWRGIALPFYRLFFGFDPRLIEALVAQQIPADVIGKIQDAAKMFTSAVVFDGMPLKDAVGFCRFILQTTIDQCTYEVGVPTCGGPLQMAVITRDEKFAWIQKLDYS